MYWILTKRQFTIIEVEEALRSLFPQLHFHHLDDSKQNWFENQYFHSREVKNYTFSVSGHTDTLKSKIEFHDLDAKTAIKMTQYIGLYLSSTYKTVVVTEIEGDDPYIAFHSLMIDGDKSVVIHDDGIENDGFEFRAVRNYESHVHTFDEYGCL